MDIKLLINKYEQILAKAQEYGIHEVCISKNLDASQEKLYFLIDINVSLANEQKITQFKAFIQSVLNYPGEISLLNRRTLAELINSQTSSEQKAFRAVLNSGIPLAELHSDSPLEKQFEEEWSEISNIISNRLLPDEKKVTLLEILIQSDINLIYLKHGLSALHIATINSGKIVAAWLLQKCPDLIYAGRLDRAGNVLFFAAMNSNLELFNYFLSIDPSLTDPKSPSLVNHKDFYNATLLHYAAMGTSLEILEKTIRVMQLENINIPDDRDYFPIHYACRNVNNELVIKYLVKNDAQLNSISKDGKYPLHSLANFSPYDDISKFSTVSLLVESGININQQTALEQETLLHLLLKNLAPQDLNNKHTMNQYFNLINKLIEQGLNPFILNAKTTSVSLKMEILRETALKSIFSNLTESISYCHSAYQLMYIFVKNGIQVENEHFIKEISYLQNSDIYLINLNRAHLEKLFDLLINFFPHFYCHNILSKKAFSSYRNKGTPKTTLFKERELLHNALEQIPLDREIYGFDDQATSATNIERCQVLLRYGFLINFTLSNDERKILETLQASLNKNFLAVGAGYLFDPLGFPKPVEGLFEMAICSTNDLSKIQDFQAWELQLKIISRILVYKMHSRIEENVLRELKLILLQILPKATDKACYEIVQFLLDHQQSIADVKFTAEEIKQLGLMHINCYHRLYDFPPLTFLAANQLVTGDVHYAFAKEQDKKTMEHKLESVGKTVPRVKENKQKILSMFFVEHNEKDDENNENSEQSSNTTHL